MKRAATTKSSDEPTVIFSFKYAKASLLFVWAIASKVSADNTEPETK